MFKKLILGGYHKTGSTLFRRIWKDYRPGRRKLKKVKHCNLFYNIKNDAIKNNKCVVIIRNPYEIIMSGVRYHQVTTEPWCCEALPEYEGLSYQQYLKKLNPDDQIFFEMNGSAKTTINAIYNDAKNRNYNENILFIKLEDLYSKKNIAPICNQIKKHLDGKICTKALIQSFNLNLKRSYKRTNKTNKYTYHKFFKAAHYERFDEIFPTDILNVLGYEDHTPQNRPLLFL